MTAKSTGAKRAGRVGANRQKIVNEKRARRPHTIKKIVKYTGISALVFAVGFALYTQLPDVVRRVTDRVSETVNYGKRTHADFSIVNCGRATCDRLLSALDSLVGCDSNYVDRADVVKAALALSEIEKVKVSRKGKDRTTVIKVTERKPVAIAHAGDIRLVDKRGIRFQAAPGQFYDLPLISFGTKARDTVDLSLFNAIKKASKTLGGDFFSQISQIDLSDGKSVNLIFKSGKTEYILGVDDIEKRMLHVKKLTERLWDEQEEPSRIDLRYRQLAFASM